jgi:hypothetical protein
LPQDYTAILTWILSSWHAPAVGPSLAFSTPPIDWNGVLTLQYLPGYYPVVLESPVQSGLLSIFGKTETETGFYQLIDWKRLDKTDVDWSLQV